jgi:iron(II)-dependent oxidoreductase
MRRVRLLPHEGRFHFPAPEGPVGAHALLRVGDPRIARFTAPAAPHTASAIPRAHAPYPLRRLVASGALPGTQPDLHGMVRVPGGTVRLHLAHMRRECGCYPDPGSPPDRIAHFLTGNPFSETLEHDYTVELAPFYIDDALVSNAAFKHFLEASGYQPQCRDNFLRHWPNGEMTEAQAELPVVYVDLDDARAYAAWAGKRLPTEPEWHRAAQGDDGRAWPWGNEFIPDHCAEGAPLPVRSLPHARSPHGCYHMSGNVWHWLDAEYDDGHTRFAIVRGGSYFRALGSGWYVPSGAQPLTSHAKMVLMSPSLDRSPTVGFRCAADC